MLSACLLAQPAVLSAAALTNHGESYEDQAAGKLRQSNELQQKIDNVSEEKRAIDEAADAAVKEHQARKAELDATEARMRENESALQELQREYDSKRRALGKRVRDIYIHGQISYLDVLFGAKDFNDLMTRMDLLKRIIRRDYGLVTEVAAVRDQLELAQAELEKDRETQAEQENRAHKARQDMEEKVARQQALIERLKTDKALIDQQYEELMAASRQVGAMIRERGDSGVMVSGSGAMICRWQGRLPQNSAGAFTRSLVRSAFTAALILVATMDKASMPRRVVPLNTQAGFPAMAMRSSSIMAAASRRFTVIISLWLFPKGSP